MKQNALDAPAKANGLAILVALQDGGKLYVGDTNVKALHKRRAKNRSARKSRRGQR